MSTFIEQIREWLDTETRELLCSAPPTKLTAVGIEFYSLLLLKYGNDRSRVDEVVTAIREKNPATLHDYPFIVAQEMTLDDALVGQFALACCDCISAFVRDEVIGEANRSFLQELNNEVASSPEFELVEVKILSIPNTESARRFCWQFLGMAICATTPLTMPVFRKKARLMEHWAVKCGIEQLTLQSD